MTSPPETPQTSVDQVADDAPVLDVRDPDEWTAGHIDGALHIPLTDLPGRLADLPPAAPLVVTCRSGGRSARATAYLQGLGIDAVNLDGGMRAWDAAGRPMVSETGQAPEVV